MKRKQIEKKISSIGLVVVAVTMFFHYQPHYVTAPDYGKEVVITGKTNSEVLVTLQRLPGGRHDWQEYQYQIKNNGKKTVSDLTITIPVYGELTAFHVWDIQAEAVDGKVIVHYNQTLKPGEKYCCTGGQKFGYSGGAQLQTPTVTAKK